MKFIVNFENLRGILIPLIILLSIVLLIILITIVISQKELKNEKVK